MPDSKDHTFGKKHVLPENTEAEAETEAEGVDEESLKLVLQRLADFKWDDTDDSDELDDMPSIEASENDISQCVESIYSFLNENLSFEHFDPTSKTGAALTIEMNCSIHRLLRARFAVEWNLDSRVELFDSIQDGVSEYLDDPEHRQLLSSKVEDIVPASHRKKFSISRVSLHDDAFTVEGDGDVVTAEVSLKFIGI